MIPAMSNSGGHIAHLGGAQMGHFYIRLLYKGIDLGEINLKPKIKRPEFKVYVNEDKKAERTARYTSMDDQVRIDEILDKIEKKDMKISPRLKKIFCMKPVKNKS